MCVEVGGGGRRGGYIKAVMIVFREMMKKKVRRHKATEGMANMERVGDSDM